MNISINANRCEPSPMRKFHPYAVKAQQQGKTIYHLNIGQPDLETPAAFFDAVRNFDAETLAYAASPGMPELLDAIMQLFPLDTYTDKPVMLMEVVKGDPVVPTIWDEYKDIINKYEPENCKIEMIERFAFYERAKTAYAVVATGEEAIYANIILKKGVVK